MPYASEELAEISNDLNKTIIRQKLSRSEGYKTGLKRAVFRQREAGFLAKLADHEIAAAIKLSVSAGTMPHLLAQELESRLEANTLSFALLQRLLFQVPHAIIPTSTREAIGKRLVDEPFRAPSLISARSEEHTSELQSLMRISYA